MTPRTPNTNMVQSTSLTITAQQEVSHNPVTEPHDLASSPTGPATSPPPLDSDCSSFDMAEDLTSASIDLSTHSSLPSTPSPEAKVPQLLPSGISHAAPFTNGHMNNGRPTPLQAEYHIASLQIPASHPYLRYLRQQMHGLWSLTLYHLTTLFFRRVRCVRCGQVPVPGYEHLNPSPTPGPGSDPTLIAGQREYNHVMPRQMRHLWHSLIAESARVDLVGVDEERWVREVLSAKLLEMERLYLEGETPGLGCGGIAWNGNRASDPIV